MEPYRYKMNRDLIEIEKNLINNKNLEDGSQLLYDRELLLCNLYNKKINKKLKYNVEQFDIQDIIYSIMRCRSNISLFKSIPVERNKDYIDRLKIFNKFLQEDFFELKETYNKILDDETLFCTKKIPRKTGCTIYLKSLKKNYVLIHGTQTPYDEAILVHELGHAKQNLLERNFVNKKLESNFCEAYSYFLMLVYFDYLKNFGYEKESYNYKCKVLNSLLIRLECLFHIADSNNIKRRDFQFNYMIVISMLLAFHLYNVYLENPKECLKLVEKFNLNYENVSDYELLKKLGLNFEVFKNNKILKTTKEHLKGESIKIKQK